MKDKQLEFCPMCRAVLVAHTSKHSIVLWCSRNPSHFRWVLEK